MVLVGMVVLKLLIYNVLYDFSFKKSSAFAWLINKT